MTIQSYYLVLVLMTTLYALFLECFKHRWEPHLTWLEVVVGTAICLSVPANLARAIGGDWAAYEQRTWAAFLVGGFPIVVWQLARMIRDYKETITEARRLLQIGTRDAHAAAPLAKQRRTQPCPGQGDCTGHGDAD
jgi:hypothetical protein